MNQSQPKNPLHGITLEQMLIDLVDGLGWEAMGNAVPNRFRNYYGAARAAEAAGDRRKAADYYAKLMELVKKSDSQRPELARARAYVAQR